MLVLSRHKDESIIIGEDIKITVIEIRGDKVRIGIAAPTNITVHRQEVYEQIASFPNYLSRGNYEKAYKVLLNGSYSPNSEELSKLEKGLSDLGKLTEDIKSELEKFIK